MALYRVIAVLCLLPLLVFGGGTINVDEDHTGHKITNVSHPPLADHDVATKKYVDDLISAVSPVWGSITGTLSNQTDLQNALDAKQNILTLGNISDAGTDGITITGGTGAIVGSGVSLAQHVADVSHNGYLSSTDWSLFNGKQNTLTLGNLTDAGTDGISISGGTGAVVGSGTSFSQHVSDSTHNGYLSSTDWSRFDSSVGGVTSWNTRTGAVVPAANDYSEAQISFTDITTNNVSTSAHGYQPKLPNDPTLFMNGLGQYVVIPNQGTIGSHLISGGGVAWTGTGFNYIISAADYIINGNEYTSAQTPVTLSPANLTFDRIDTFYVDSGGLAGVITGVAASPPIAPAVDPATQLALTFAFVPANSTQPVITNENIYLENTEWTTSTNSAGTINLASTNNPYAGTKDIEGTATVSGNLFTAVKPSGTLKPSDYTNLIFQIRSKASWPNAKAISIFWMNGGSSVGGAATLKQGAFGFNSGNTTTYQQIVIPTSVFNTGTSAIDSIRFQITGGGGSIGWYIDNIILQTGGGGTTGGGDFSTNTNTSVVNEIVLFADTTGKLGKRSTGTGIATLTSGVLGTAAQGNLTDVGTDGITVTGGTGAVVGSGTSFAQHISDSTHNGYLGSTDFNSFTNSRVTTIGFTNDGSGTTVTTGVKGYFVARAACTITGWSIAAQGSSPTCTIDVWKIAAGTALPTVTNTITASDKPVLSSGNVSNSAHLTGWTTSVAVGDIFGYNLDAVTNATRVTFEMEVTK